MPEEGGMWLEQLARLLAPEATNPRCTACVRAWPELFTQQRLQIPDLLHKCLATTNIVESPQGGVERRTNKVTRP